MPVEPRIAAGRGASRGHQALALAACLLPVLTEAGVVISEIMYHPASGAPGGEYIELYNRSERTQDISGWRLAEAVRYVFPEGAVLQAGAYLVVASDPAGLSAAFALPPGIVFGPWSGALSNRGERIALLAADGTAVNTVAYDDGPPWPMEADGGGPSLECINPLLPNDTARNWQPSRPDWFHVSTTGTATSSTLYLYLLGAGTCHIDDIVLEPASGGENHVPNGAFASGIAPWQVRGNHGGSFFNSAEGRHAPGCLTLVAGAAGSGGAHSVACDLAPLLAQGGAYRLSFWVKFGQGATTLVSRLSGGGLRRDSLIPLGRGTPGRPNSVRADVLPPLVAEVTMTPVLPREQERAVLSARVEADGPATVILRYEHGGAHEIPLLDDGEAPDQAAGDGIYTGRLPGFPAGTLVWFTVTAQENGLHSRPFPSGAGIAGSTPPDTGLPVYWIFVAPEDWNRLNADIWTDQYVPALLVHDDTILPRAGLRFRGGRPRLFRKKSLKLRFYHSRFMDRRRLNLNSAVMDDDYMSEPLAYAFYERAGVTASETRFVRVQLNGEFWGLFIGVEQVDKDYLSRWGLDPEGALYKAVGIASNLSALEGTAYTYQGQYEKKTRLDEPHDDLIAFIHGLTTEADAEEYLERNLDVQGFARYLAATNLMCVWDAIQHNYYLYRPPGPDARWRVIPWDLDHAWGEWEWYYYYDNTYPLLMGHENHRFAGAWYTWNKLWTVFFDVPRFRTMYFMAIRELLNTEFTEWRVFPRIDAYREAIAATVLLDEAKWPDAAEPLRAAPPRTMAEELPLLRENISRRRRFVAGLLGVALQEEPSNTFRRGDINADGQVNLGDVIAHLAYLFSGGALPCQKAADVNDDGVLDVADAIRLLAYLFGSGAPPPPPFDRCGEDPTPDALTCDSFAPCR